MRRRLMYNIPEDRVLNGKVSEKSVIISGMLLYLIRCLRENAP